MPLEDFIDRPEFLRWQMTGTRLTAFFLESIQISEINWWREIVGELPDDMAIQSKGRVREESANTEFGKLRLKCEPNRADWILSATPDEVIDRILPPVMENKEVALNHLLQTVNSWFDICPEIKRIAFGSLLLLPVDDHDSGYLKLNDILPSVDIDTESSDFIYQINRRRPSLAGPETMQINRLSNWSLQHFISLGNFQVNVGNEVQVGVIPASNEVYAVHVNLDINTMAEFDGAIPKELLSPQFNELVELGLEIACEGDIP